MNDETFILCELAGVTYGIASRVVQQVEMVEHITPIPNAPAELDGVVFARGQLIPVLNMRQRLGYPKQPHDLRTRLIVIRVGERVVGLLVDSAREFVTIPNDAIQPPPEGVDQISGDYLAGIARVGERLALLLRIDELPANLVAGVIKG
jgi:purine-binding chemotaxis protein CheW